MLKIGMKKQIHCICFMRVSREKTKEKEIITLKREATSKNVEEKHKKKNPTLSDGASAKVVSNFGTT